MTIPLILSHDYVVLHWEDVLLFSELVLGAVSVIPSLLQQPTVKMTLTGVEFLS